MRCNRPLAGLHPAGKIARQPDENG